MNRAERLDLDPAGALLSRALRGPCAPGCLCDAKLAFFNAMHDRVMSGDAGFDYTLDELADMLVSITTMLHCVSAHHANRKVRRQATVQLFDPIYQWAEEDDEPPLRIGHLRLVRGEGN